MKLFSFDTVVVHYIGNISELKANHLTLANIDFDTGNKTAIGEYTLTDQTYQELVIKLKEKNFNFVSAALKKNILNFYHENNAPASTDGEQQQEFKEALDSLKNVHVS